MKIRTAIAKLLWMLKNGKPHPEYKEFLRLKEMHVSETGLNAILQGSAVPALIDSFGKYLDAYPEAKNHLSVECFHPKYGRLEVLIQKADGKTPAQINMELKSELATLRRELAVAKRALLLSCKDHADRLTCPQAERGERLSICEKGCLDRNPVTCFEHDYMAHAAAELEAKDGKD